MAGFINCLFGIAVGGLLSLWSTPSAAVSASDLLADRIQSHVQQAVSIEITAMLQANVTLFEKLAVAGSWTETWPAGSGEVSRNVEGYVWNASIQAALDACGTAFLPNRGAPYYINTPIVLKSGQRLIADPQAEIRLVPGTNTCMVRNEHIVSGQYGPIPANATPDTGMLVQGGIWTTLATTYRQTNGNNQGWPNKGDTTIPGHGVILMSNASGVAVKDVVIRESQGHGIQVSNCVDFLAENIVFQSHRCDGVHVNGPTAYGVIRNISGVTADDLIALNAWDWKNRVPSFGAISHILVEGVHGNPQLNGTDEIRLLPGTKTFADNQTLDCSVENCVLRDLRDIRTVKIYDQPNGELGRDVDYSDPIGTIRDVYIENLITNRPTKIQIAENVEGLSVDNVRLNFDLDAPDFKNYRLVEVGPKSQTACVNPNDPSTWVELFSPDKDMTVRNVRLTNVSAIIDGIVQPLPRAEARLVQVASQKPNPDYPATTPRGGVGKVRLLEGCLISAAVANPPFETGSGNSAASAD